LLGEPSAAAQDSRIQSCVVEPGQVIYVPTGWHHATCNLDDFTLSLGGQGDVADMSDLATA
jgi:oxalate decarboxylase/phosphoglucose isomerase-like protein (cupin superfamily)